METGKIVVFKRKCPLCANYFVYKCLKCFENKFSNIIKNQKNEDIRNRNICTLTNFQELIYILAFNFFNSIDCFLFFMDFNLFPFKISALNIDQIPLLSIILGIGLRKIQNCLNTVFPINMIEDENDNQVLVPRNLCIKNTADCIDKIKHDCQHKHKKSIFTVVKNKKSNILQSGESNECVQYVEQIPLTNCCKNGLIKKLLSKKNKHGFEATVMKIKKNIKPKENLKRGNHLKILFPYIATSYRPKIDETLFYELKYLYNSITNLHNNEHHLLSVLQRYIQDASLKEHLLKASHQYFFTLDKYLNRSLNLFEELYAKQMDLITNDQLDLQIKYKLLHKQNRVLRSEIDVLCSNYEKITLSKKLISPQLLKLTYIGSKFSCNRNLRKRINILAQTIEVLERELDAFQERIKIVEDERFVLRSNVYSYKDILKQAQINFDLQKTAIISQHDIDKRNLKLIAAAIQDVLRSCEIFKKNLENTPITVDWPKISDDPTSFSSFIYQCRNCMEDLIRGIMSSHSDTASIIKDTNSLRETNAKLQENLQKATNELNVSMKKLDITNENELQQQCEALQDQVKNLERKLEKSSDMYRSLNHELEEAGRELNEANNTIIYTLEDKEYLKRQIEGLVSVLSQDQNGDIAKNLIISKEKFSNLYRQLFQISNDYKALNEKFNNLKMEHHDLLVQNSTFREEILALQVDLQQLLNEYNVLKKQNDMEHETVLSLQIERVKYLDEKNVLKTVFQQMKSEISRIPHLEQAVSQLKVETNKLDQLALENQEVEENLKSQLEIRDNAIVKLKENVERLSCVPFEYCEAEKSICSKLPQESTATINNPMLRLQKKLKLDFSAAKRDIDYTKSQMDFKDMEKSERNILRKFLKDFRQIIKERKKLQETRKTQDEENTHLKYQLRDKLHLCKTLEEQLQSKNEEISLTNEKLINMNQRIVELESKNRDYSHSAEKTIEKLKQERDEMFQTMEHLNNNIYKLNKDLNTSREKEKEIILLLDVNKQEYASINREFQKCQNQLQLKVEEINLLHSELNDSRSKCDQQIKILDELVNKYIINEKSYLQEIDENLNLIRQYAGEIQYLNELLTQREEKNENLQLECFKLKELNNAQACYLDSFGQLETAYNNLKQQSKIDQNNLRAALDTITILTAEIQNCSVDQIQHKYVLKEEYKNFEDELQIVSEELCGRDKKYNELIAEDPKFAFNLKPLEASMENEKQAYQSTVHSHTEISANNEKFAKQKKNLKIDFGVNTNARLKIETVQQENAAHSDLENKYNILKNDLEKCLSEKNAIAKQILISKAEVEKHKFEVEYFKKEIKNLKKQIQEKQNLYSETENELAKAKTKIFDFELRNCELTLKLRETEIKLEREMKLHRKSLK